jgi:hypothetical protein
VRKRWKKHVIVIFVWKNWTSQPSFLIDIFTSEDAVFHGLSFDIIKSLEGSNFWSKKVKIYVIIGIKAYRHELCLKNFNKPTIVSPRYFHIRRRSFSRAISWCNKTSGEPPFFSEKGENIYHNRHKKHVGLNFVWKNWISQLWFFLDIFTLEDAVFQELSPGAIKFLGTPHFSVKKVKILEKAMLFLIEKSSYWAFFPLRWYLCRVSKYRNR